MPDKPPYLIDTDVLEHIRHRADAEQIYTGLIGMAKDGKLKTVRQVFGELKKHKSTHKVLAPHERHFVVSSQLQYCVEVQEKMAILNREAAYLWPQIGGKNPDPADPWLVAVAATHGCTLVTDEKQDSPARIPAACKLPKIACKQIAGPHFLVTVGLVTEIKPEHLSPKLFFGY